MSRIRSGLRDERGSVMLWVLGGFLVLVSFAALAIDAGTIYVARTQLASAADAGALAAMQVLREGGTMLDAGASAVAVAEANKVVAGGVRIGAGDLVWGDWDFASRTFTPGGMSLAPAVEVRARRSAGSASGRLPLALASVIGSSTADVEARAVATAGCREIVLVQDVTVSFAEEIADARDALRSVVQAMLRNGLPGDKLGLVIFAAERRTLVPLSELPQAGGELLAAIDQVVDCRYDPVSEINPVSEIFPGLHQDSCGGTDQAMGIVEAMDLFARAGPSACGAQRLIVIISDGVPCGTFSSGGHPPGGTEAGVMAAADAAEFAGLSISPIMLFDPFTPQHQCAMPGMGALVFNNSMARGFGRPLDTPDPAALDDLLRSVLSQIPVRLVQ